MLPTGRQDLPREVARRAQIRRADLPTNSVDYDPGAVNTIKSATAAVLCVDVLPATQTGLVEQLSAWRETLPRDAELVLIERTRSSEPQSAVEAMRTLAVARWTSLRGRQETSPVNHVVERDVVAGVRAAGWTIASIDRIELDAGEGQSTWVDLRAIDLRARIAEEEVVEPDIR